MRSAEDVLQFWFEQHNREDWFGGSPEFDREIRDGFAETHARVGLGEAFSWRGTTEGRLAEVLVLDQFSRQLYRNNARAFAWDGMALALAQEAVAGGFDRALEGDRRMFLYMPYQHSESLLVHEEAMRLFAGLPGDWAEYEVMHYGLIKRFGRYPKRNAVLGRPSTTAEDAYCAEVGNRMF